MLYSIVFLVGCSAFGRHELTYIGDTSELADIPAPPGFTISPQDVNEILLAHRGLEKFVEDYYHNGDSYYVVDGFFGSKQSDALADGYIINGQNGEVFDRLTLTWTPYRRTGNGSFGSSWAQASDHDRGSD